MSAQISAHRRDSAGVTGLRDAAASGAEYVELDLRRAGDGELVVLHDAAVRHHPVRRLTRARIEELTGRPVLTAAEAMRMVAPGVRGHLDLKEPGVEHEAVELALATFGPGNFVITTREVETIARVKRLYPDAPTALSVGRAAWERGAAGDLLPLRAVRESGADMVALNHRLVRLGVLHQCWRAGYPVMLWTVNHEKHLLRYLHDPRVRIVITDRPRTALALR